MIEHIQDPMFVPFPESLVDAGGDKKFEVLVMAITNRNDLFDEKASSITKRLEGYLEECGNELLWLHSTNWPAIMNKVARTIVTEAEFINISGEKSLIVVKSGMLVELGEILLSLLGDKKNPFSVKERLEWKPSQKSTKTSTWRNVAWALISIHPQLSNMDIAMILKDVRTLGYPQFITNIVKQPEHRREIGESIVKFVIPTPNIEEVVNKLGSVF